ncbi:uncharacterized protein [Polyergus mexicanus]|uniref:uncharacterized protein n=1 Tax=Polyergus mexicanus TaxID=615972 RepID=UPI0038B68788
MLKKAVINVQSNDNACFAWAVVAALYPAEKNADRESSYPHYTTVLNLEGVKFPMSLNKITRFELLPTKDDKWLEFRNYSRKERLPFVVYADLECVLKKKEESRTSNTSIVQHHEVYSVGYYARCALNGVSSTYRAYRGEDCVLWFVKELRDLALRAKTILDTDAPMMDLTPDEWERFVSATRCSVCERPFESGDARVRDHCHLTGRYRGPAHSNCNLNYKDTYVIPVFFHNLSGYDAHFIIKDVANAFPGSVEVLPITKETYISFTKNVGDAWDEGWFGRRLKLRFVDSFKFLSASLEKLASYLDKSELRIARSEFSDLSDADFELLARKGVFPYEYVDDVDKLLETRLSPREAFHSSLTGDAISESDYARAISVWERFRVETLGNFSDLYLKTDVLLLADVFENFRDACMRSYNLDPAYYYTLPGYTWDAMLKYTGVRFELLTDINMVMFVERGIRGGLSQCSNRYARANNKILRFAQSPWLRECIELNTRLRINAKNEFEKNLYKLMNNAVFGKTMENVRKHSNVRLVTRWDGRYGAEAMIAKPNFHSRSVFAEDLVAVELRKLEVKFNKPIYVGMCILDISKIRLYEFHYEYMLPLYRDKCRIMYTDTDSLIYRVECEDVYENMKRDIDRFDTSDYATDNAYGMPLANKKIPGAMKDENAGAIITEFIGLRAKMYALRVDGRSDTKKIKGVKSGVVARTVTFDDYARCLRRGIEMKREQFCIRSELHEMYTVSELKIPLSPHDDKRYAISGTTDTLPWGHYKIPL